MSISDEEFDANEREWMRSREDARAARRTMEAAIVKHVADPVARREIEASICAYVGAVERSAMALEFRNNNR